jgi:general secretion pathway protein N
VGIVVVAYLTHEAAAGDVGIEMKPARLLLLLTGFTLLRAIAAATEPPALAGNPLWKLPVMELSSTRERPIFSASRRPPTMPTYVAPVAIRPPVKPPELERPAVSLVGTVIGTDVHIGVFLETATKNVVRLRVGEDHQRWVLRLITAREVTLVKDSGQAMVLNLPPPGEASDGLPRVATGTIPVVSNENYVDKQPRPLRARQKH